MHFASHCRQHKPATTSYLCIFKFFTLLCGASVNRQPTKRRNAMARGTCYFITRDANDNGEEFDESTLVELAQYEFDRVTDVRGDERRQSIADLLAGFQKMGAAVDGDAVTFGDCFRTKWFTESFRRVQEIVASMTVAEFAEDASRYIPDGEEDSCSSRIYPLSLVRRLIDDEYADAVWHEGKFYSLDDFIRGYATGSDPFYVRGAVYMK